MPEILDEDMLRDLMVRSTSDLVASPAAATAAMRRQRHRRLRRRVLTVAGTAAAAGIAAGTMASASGPGAPGVPGVPGRLGGTGGAGTASREPAIRLTAAQQALFSLSSAAAATPRPSGRYAVLAEKSTNIDSGSGWSSSEIGPKTSVIDMVTGGGVTYQDITVSGAGAGDTPTPPGVLNSPPGSSPTRAQLDALPTDPTALRAVLLAQAQQQARQAQQFMEQQFKKLRAEDKNFKYVAAPEPASGVTDASMVFEQATDLLWEPTLSPQLRSALYKVLADTPGVTVQTSAKDSAGRPATEISRYDAASKTNVETFENPATGATLESAWRSPGSFDEDLYLSTTYTNNIPANPYES
jgi:hypothetical protein